MKMGESVREKELLAEIERLKKILKETEINYKAQNAEILKAKEQAEHNEKMLQALVEAAAGKIGQDFFDNIVARLSEWLGADCVLIGQMTENERIKAVPLYLDGKISHDFSYALQDTPCAITSRKGFCAYPEDVINLFPRDKILVDLNAQGYIGTALYNKNGQANGVICAVSRNKLKVPPYAQMIMKIIGARVTAEIERKKVEEALTVSEAELRESNATKDKFFSLLGHDLVSPIGAIQGYMNLMGKSLKKGETESFERYLEIIGRSTQSVLELLDDLLTWSRSQRGMMDFSVEQIKVSSIVDSSVELVREMANNKNIKLLISIPDSNKVLANENMLKTVVRNLVTNAIKFTDCGGEVKIYSQVSEVKDGKICSITIEDNGIGISKDTLEKLFHIEESFSTKGTSNEKGTGMGLIICKEFVENNNGKIEVSSKPGVGSKFTVHLKSA